MKPILWIFIATALFPLYGQAQTNVRKAASPSIQKVPRISPPLFNTYRSGGPGASPATVNPGRITLWQNGDNTLPLGPSAITQDNNYFVTVQDQGATSTLEGAPGEHHGSVLFRVDGGVGSVDQSKALTLQALSNLDGSAINLHPANLMRDGYKDRSGSIGFMSIQNMSTGSGIDRLSGPAFTFYQLDPEKFAASPTPNDETWSTLFTIDKTGDVRLGNGRSKSTYPKSSVSIDRSSQTADGNQWATGTRLFFDGDANLYNDLNIWNNGDPLYIHRFNLAQNKSILRVNIGSGGEGELADQDKMELGFYKGGGGYWNQAIALYANGQISARKVVVTTEGYPDYVFKPSYRLQSLQEVEQAIQTEGHLPGMPSAAEVEAKGMDLGEQNRLLVEKVEELTLYLIQMRKELDALKAAQK